MRLRYALVLLGAAALAACGGRPEGQVRFAGETPKVGTKKDLRAIDASCPACDREVELGIDRCPDTKCGQKIRWSEDYACRYCGGSRKCQACIMMEQPDGKCYNCKGRGYLTYIGQSKPCPNCSAREKGKCPTCKGSTECDFCAGKGTVAISTLKERVRKPAPEEGDPGKMPQKQ